MFLELYTLPNSTSGIDQIFKQTITVLPGLPTLILTFVWFVIFLGGMGQQKLRTGLSESSTWAVVASISIFMLSLIMTSTTGIISITTLGIVIAITILSGVWLFFDKRQGEM